MENMSIGIRSSETESKNYMVPKETPNGGKLYKVVKRILDFICSLLACIVLVLPMIVIAIIIKCDSKGPVIYKQERLGINGKKFNIYKFRTMRNDAEADGPQWAQRNDERCTRIGRKLRNCRLDELPQFINILKGNMSFVGPRPERECFYEEFETYIHGFKNRLAVTPGLTGMAQVNGGYDLEPEEKIVYDMEYIKTQSLWVDIKLVFKTVKLVFTHEGAR